MNERPFKQRSAVMTLVMLAACGGQAPAGQEGSGNEGRVSQDLYGDTAAMWPLPFSGPLAIPVCWQDPSGPDIVRNGYQITEDQLRAWTRDAIEQGWQRFANINFTGWGICPSSFTGIRVEGRSPGNPNTAAGSYTHRNDPTAWMHLAYVAEGRDCAASVAAMENCARYNALHEFGHALGFLHEEQRPDYTGDNCLSTRAPSPNPVTYGAYDLGSVMSYCNAISVSAPNYPTELSPGDVAGIQRAYRRRAHGNIVTSRGDCLYGPTAGGNVAINDCAAVTSQVWSRGTQGQLSTTCPGFACGPFPTRACLDSGGSTANGTNAIDTGCSGASTQQWALEQMYLRGWGGLCLDLQYGDTTNGNVVQLWHCGDYGGANQRWTIPGDGTIRYGGAGSTKCLTAGFFEGDTFYLWDCVGTVDQSFSFFADGSIHYQTTDNFCVDLQGWSDSTYLSGQGQPYSSELLESLPCSSGQLSQKWNLTGPLRDAASNKCVRNPDSTDVNDTLQQMWDCTGAEDQQWDIYLP
jgi:hypothetical protein